jgi:hypothetical protein
VDWRKRFTSSIEWQVVDCIQAKLAHDCRLSITPLQWSLTGFMYPTLETLDQNKRTNGGAHEAAYRPLFTCAIRVLGCSVIAGRDLSATMFLAARSTEYDE